MQLNTEQRILRVMRKVLASIVRDTTPNPGMRHPLNDKTIEDIRECFTLISAREQELIAENKQEASKMRPRYPDDKREQKQDENKVVFFKKDNDKSDK